MLKVRPVRTRLGRLPCKVLSIHPVLVIARQNGRAESEGKDPPPSAAEVPCSREAAHLPSRPFRGHWVALARRVTAAREEGRAGERNDDHR